MAVPGFSVSELLHVAKKLYTLINAYRDAPREIAVCSFQISMFISNLQRIIEVLPSPTSALLGASSDSDQYALSCYNKCVDHCKEFLVQIQGKSDLKQRGNWLLKNKDKAVTLGKEIDLLNSTISLSLVSDIAKHVRPDTQCAAAGHSSQRSQATSRRPADLLSVTSHERDCQRDSPTAKVIDFEEIDPLDRSASVELYHKPSPNETRPDWSPEDLFGSFWQPSSTQTRPQESVARRESLLCTYTIDAHMTMVDLVSASISYSRSANQIKLSKKTVYRIEFLKDSDGTLCFLSITTTPSSDSRLYQSICVNPRTIPHSEHPIAYKGQNSFVVKFLQPHQLMLERRSRSASTTSNSSLRTPSLGISPGTIGSSNSCQDTLDIGSPLISPGSYIVTKESDYPRYEFGSKDDYVKFQESLMGTVLLVNLPVNFVFYKLSTKSKPRKQAERQYLRLWDNKGNQTIMFYANLYGKYIEHNMLSFLRPTSEANKYTLAFKMNITSKMPTPPAISRSWSRISNRTLTPEMETLDDDPLGELKALESMIIEFTDSDGPRSFLEKARFGTPLCNSPSSPKTP